MVGHFRSAINVLEFASAEPRDLRIFSQLHEIAPKRDVRAKQAASRGDGGRATNIRKLAAFRLLSKNYEDDEGRATGNSRASPSERTREEASATEKVSYS